MPYPHIIYVEGPDDLHAIGHLLDRNDIQTSRFDEGRPALLHDVIAVKKLGGYPKLRKPLAAELKASSELLRAGIVVDANSNPTGRWQSLRELITEVGGQSVPHELSPEGWVGEIRREDRTIRVGVWLMPDNQVPGAIEEFARSLLPSDDALWPYAVQCVDGLVEVMEPSRFAGLPRSKAIMHTWLAWQQDPGNPMGAAIRDGVLDPLAEPAQRFVSWERPLFSV